MFKRAILNVLKKKDKDSIYIERERVEKEEIDPLIRMEIRDED